ncbi:hypothetical protein Hte_007727 [Hypoxylon texense]
MDSNYFTSLYMAHATLQSWLKPSPPSKNAITTNSSTDAAAAAAPSSSSSSSSHHGPPPPPARHLIFTASFLAFFSVTGFAPYSPCKAALRALSDTLSQEMNLYAAAHPRAPRVRLHTVFPATIFTESYEAENRIKTDVTKMLEEGDDGQTPEVVAARSIRGLERGQELITTEVLAWLVKRSMLGGSVRGGFLQALGDWIVACIMGIVMVFVREDVDRKVRAWGRKYGASGMKKDDKQT